MEAWNNLAQFLVLYSLVTGKGEQKKIKLCLGSKLTCSKILDNEILTEFITWT